MSTALSILVLAPLMLLAIVLIRREREKGRRLPDRPSPLDALVNLSSRLAPPPVVLPRRDASSRDASPREDTDAAPLLCLCMIVKDEAQTIGRTLERVKPWIDRWLILDTGSIDGTQEAVRKALEGVSGELREGPFVDFATARNLALSMVENLSPLLGFVLFLDADDLVEHGGALRAFLETEQDLRGPDHEVFFAQMALGSNRWDSPRVARLPTRWRYVGKVHEVLTCPSVPPPSIRIPGLVIRHDPSGDSPERSKARWERDADLLEAALAENPQDTRSLFYLAQTYNWLGWTAAAEVMYGRRIEAGGWEEEVYESRMALARIAERDRPWPAAEGRYLAAFAGAPSRAEPLYAIAAHYNAERQPALCYLFARRGYDLPLPPVTLFVDEEVYRWRLAELVGISAWYVGEYEIGERAACQALEANPDDERLRRNLEHYLERKTERRTPRIAA